MLTRERFLDTVGAMHVEQSPQFAGAISTDQRKTARIGGIVTMLDFSKRLFHKFLAINFVASLDVHSVPFNPPNSNSTNSSSKGLCEIRGHPCDLNQSLVLSFRYIFARNFSLGAKLSK